MHGTVTVALVSACLLLGGCGQEDDVISKERFTQIRRDNIRLVNEVLPHVATRKVQSSEEIGPCTDLGPENQLQSDFEAGGPVRDDAMEYIRTTLGPRLKAEGWMYRDRPNYNDVFDRIWFKDDNSFGIRIESEENEGRPFVYLTTVSPCADARGIDSGAPRPADPWYIPLDS